VLLLVAVLVLLAVMQIGSEIAAFKPVDKATIKKDEKNEGMGVLQPPVR
jgi:hypothetical protein